MSVELSVIKECLGLHEFLVNDCNVPYPFNKIMYVNGEEFGIPTFFLAGKGDDYYVSIRGAGSASDFLLALDVERVEYMDGTVHRGVYAGAKGIYDRIIDRIKGCKGRVVCTGHSLGGATSSVLATLINFEAEITSVAVSLAPFPVFSPSLAELTESFITSFVYNNDLVPLLSASNARMLLPFFGINLNDPSGATSSPLFSMMTPILQQLSGFSGVQVDPEQLKSRISSAINGIVSVINRNLEEFYVPGTCYHFVKDVNTNSCKVYGFQQGRSFDFTMLLTGVADHDPNLYINAISNWDGNC